MKVSAVPDKSFCVCGRLHMHAKHLHALFDPTGKAATTQPPVMQQQKNKSSLRPSLGGGSIVTPASNEPPAKKKKIVAWLPGESRSLEERDELLGGLGDVVGELDDLLGLEAEVGLRLLVGGRGPVFALLPQPHGAHCQLVQGFLHLARGAPLHTSGGWGGLVSVAEDAR